MREILERAAKLRAEGRSFAIATVVRTSGSTPQVVGAKLLADDLGRLVGTLGGGCVEADAVDEAKHVLASGEPSLREYELTEDLAFDTGLVCGGTMWIAVEHGRDALRAAQRDLLDDLLDASRGGAPVALATLLRRDGRAYATAGARRPARRGPRAPRRAGDEPAHARAGRRRTRRARRRADGEAARSPRRRRRRSPRV